MSFYNQAWDRPYLTPSIAVKLLYLSPYHARLACPYYTRERTAPTQAMAEGTVVDRLVFGAPLDGVEVLDVDDFRTKAAKQMRDDAEAAGKSWIKAADYERCVNAAVGVRLELERVDLAAFTAINRGQAQVRDFWEEATEYGSVWCSSEPDLYDPATFTVYDLKRTATPPTADNWRRHVASMHYHIQAAATLESTGAHRFRWIVVEAKPPHLVVVHNASDALLSVGQRNWDQAKAIWARCVSTDDWPGYEGGIIDPMPWMLDPEDGEMTFDEEDEAA